MSIKSERISVNKVKGKIMIYNFINGLFNQINKDSDLNYVLLNLDNTNADILNYLLQDEAIIKYILKTYHKDTLFVDNNNNSWSLCITGFKHGAKKNSPRKLGLLAYNLNPIIKSKFKTKIIYNSFEYNKYGYITNAKSYHNEKLKKVIDDINKYLNENSEPNVNYIKSEKKVKPVKKVKRVKPVKKVKKELMPQ